MAAHQGFCVRVAVAWLTIMLLAAPARGNHSVNELLSIGPSGGNGNTAATFQGATPDALSVFFRTEESLVVSDNDGAFDIYKRVGNTTTQESVGPQAGVGLDTSYVANSSNGDRVFFSTRDQLVSQDTDAGLDIYERSNGTTSLFPNSASAAAETTAVDYTIASQGMSPDGTRVFFSTPQQLVPQDTDNARDVYERSSGTVMLVSTGPNGGNGAFPATFNGASSDGARVFFTTTESLVSGDTDSWPDVYERSAGVTTQLSVGPGSANGAHPAEFAGASSNGSRVFFITSEALVGFPDSDAGYRDVYERSGGTTTLLSYGPNGFDGPYDVMYGGNTADGTKVWFQTTEALVSSDTDGGQDVYERSPSGLRFVSSDCVGFCGQAASFEGASADGSHVIFSSVEFYTGVGSCGYRQIYDRQAGGTSLVSGGGCGNHWYLQKVSVDGSRFLLSANCFGPCVTFERFSGSLTQITDGGFGSASPDARRVVFETTNARVGADTDSAQDVYALSVAGSASPSTAYPRPQGATPYRVSLVPAFKPCAGPNSTHGAPLAYPSCSPPELTSDQLTVGTNDANGQPAKFSGFVKLEVAIGNPATPADEADNLIAVGTTDIRQKSNLADYTGELRVQTALRMTDKLNGASGTDGATVQDFPFSFVVPCSATTDTTVGSSCSLSTSLDSLVPGMVPEGKRTVTHLDDVLVYDGGADGDGETTGDNTLFAWQGIFTP